MYTKWISTLQKVQKTKKIGSYTERLADKAILALKRLVVLLNDTELMSDDSLICNNYQRAIEVFIKLKN
jgi:hypothetical protein